MITIELFEKGELEGDGLTVSTDGPIKEQLVRRLDDATLVPDNDDNRYVIEDNWGELLNVLMGVNWGPLLLNDDVILSTLNNNYYITIKQD